MDFKDWLGVLLRILIFGALMILLGYIMSSYAQAQKLKGALIHSPSELAQTSHYANAFGFLYRPGNIKDYAAVNDRHYTMLIVISGYLQDQTTGLFGDDVDTLIDELQQHYSWEYPLIIMLDEPEWLTRLACKNGKQAACLEVTNQYQQTRANLSSVAQQLKAAIPGIKISHNVAWAEIVLQMQATGKITMIEEADLYSFDCYGSWIACGDPEYGYYRQDNYGAAVYDEMMRHEKNHPTGRQMLLIPGAYHYSPAFYNDYAVLAQLEVYRKWHSSDFVAGSAIFYHKGHTHMQKVKAYLAEQFGEW